MSAVSFSLTHTDGSLRKTNNRVLMAELEKMVDVQLKLPQVTTSTIYIAHDFDAMALVHMPKSFGASTFNEIALKYYQLITVPLALNGCHRVAAVCDFSLSINRLWPGVQIRGPATPGFGLESRIN